MPAPKLDAAVCVRLSSRLLKRARAVCREGEHPQDIMRQLLEAEVIRRERAAMALAAETRRAASPDRAELEPYPVPSATKGTDP